ncbi:hypothetical protein Pmani_003182 [Petrolisthes manimaculis]|uniref:CUB domain-containing protein n=1 Tax=Petrolisthes manimaculis TaxID=1843537 RepID=A0AAE1QG81_9EUCA|nr:hypothetical protein Pmani_003182 [Petrolisthes manimaculis]
MVEGRVLVGVGVVRCLCTHTSSTTTTLPIPDEGVSFQEEEEEDLRVPCGAHSVPRGACLTFTSPDFPANYPPNYTCQWKFKAVREGEVKLSCDWFHLARDRGDFLSVKATTSGHFVRLGPMSGGEGLVLPSNVTVTVGAHSLNPEGPGGGLERALTLSQTVWPVCLAPRSWASDDFLNTTLTAIGWGKTETGKARGEVLERWKNNWISGKGKYGRGYGKRC